MTVAAPPSFLLWRPIAPLRPYVDCIWEARGRTDYRSERVLPNGVVELILNLGAPHRVVDVGPPRRDRRFHRAWVAGLQRSHLTIANEDGSDLVGVRFRPGGARPFLRAPLLGFTDRVEEAGLLGLSPLEPLREQLFAAPGFVARARRTEAWLLAQLPLTPASRLVRGALVTLEQWGGELTMAALARQVGVTHQHLIRRFHQDVGVTPRKLSRILRFHRVVQAVHGKAQVSWARLAADFHYADQAHLVRDFREFSGLPPRAFLAARTPDGFHLRAG